MFLTDTVRSSPLSWAVSMLSMLSVIAMKAEDNKNLLVPDPYASRVVCDIFRMRLEGASASKIASELNRLGILSPLAYKKNNGLPYAKKGYTHTHSVSIETQQMIIARYLEQYPEISVYDTYIDNGATGTNFHRPGFQQMLSDIEAGHVNCVIVKDLSRLGRNTIDTGYYIEQYFRIRNIRFIAVNENFDTAAPEDAHSGIIIPLRNMINEAYALDIGRKIKAQQRQAMKASALGSPAEHPLHDNGGNRVDDKLVAIVLRFQIAVGSSRTDELAVLHGLPLLRLDLAPDVQSVGFVYHVP